MNVQEFTRPGAAKAVQRTVDSLIEAGHVVRVERRPRPFSSWYTHDLVVDGECITFAAYDGRIEFAWMEEGRFRKESIGIRKRSRLNADRITFLLPSARAKRAEERRKDDEARRAAWDAEQAALARRLNEAREEAAATERAANAIVDRFGYRMRVRAHVDREATRYPYKPGTVSLSIEGITVTQLQALVDAAIACGFVS